MDLVDLIVSLKHLRAISSPGSDVLVTSSLVTRFYTMGMGSDSPRGGGEMAGS
jgi:hypothetical protein